MPRMAVFSTDRRNYCRADPRRTKRLPMHFAAGVWPSSPARITARQHRFPVVRSPNPSTTGSDPLRSLGADQKSNLKGLAAISLQRRFGGVRLPCGYFGLLHS